MASPNNFLDADASLMEQNLKFVKTDMEEELNQFFSGAPGDSVTNAYVAPPRDYNIVQPKPAVFRSKTTNKVQLQLLADLMASQPAIARGFYKGNREDLAQFWEKVELELNSAGPPMKCIMEWKKVWTDQKKYVRQKAAENKKFSPIEEQIFNLIGTRESVEGLPIKKFGLPDVSNEASSEVETKYTNTYIHEDATLNEVPIATNGWDSMDELPCTSKEALHEKLQQQKLQHGKRTISEQTSDPLLTSAPQNKEVLAAFEESLRIQGEMCTTIKGLVTDQKQIQEQLSTMCYIQSKHYKTIELIERRKLAELKRHNRFMEGMRKKEVRRKLRKPTNE